MTAISKYNDYIKNNAPWDSRISDEYFEGEIMVLDDEVGGIVYLFNDGQKIDYIDKIISSIEEDINKAKNVSDKDDYNKIMFHLSTLLEICKEIKDINSK